MLARVCYEPRMSDREITLELAAATRVTLYAVDDDSEPTQPSR